MRVTVMIEGVGRDISLTHEPPIARLGQEKEELTKLLDRAYKDAKQWIEENHSA